MATTRGWALPTDGGSANTWGSILNDTTFPAIDTDVTSVEATADAALPKAGGTMTGELALKVATTPITALGSVSGNVNLDCTLGHVFTLTCTAATTLVLQSVPAGVALGILVKVTNGAAGTFTHPTGTLWAAGAAPTMSSGTDWIGYILTNSGTAPIGIAVALAVA
jgi:hypothetical protein